MKNVEILAPAGAMEHLIAAVRCGANAVYLGGKAFNARRNATNFEEGELAEAVRYCHGRDVKVYVTVNTLVMDDEMGKLEEEADYIANACADGVIIQDMAVMKLFREKYPTIKRLASTQTAVHDVAGAKLLEDMGFESVVLARELSLGEMEKICSSIKIRAEAFVHGAHCMSVSGACYLSAMLGGRSGNRGLCAQPCRLNFRSGQREYALSLKDMSLISHARAMAEAGVSSFKIEGRMKRPEYVAAAVTALSAALDGKDYDVETLERVFSRGGFTDGYLKGSRNVDMFGRRTQEDADRSAKVLGKLSELYRRENPLIPIDVDFKMLEGAAAELDVYDGKHACSVEGPIPEEAINKNTGREEIERLISKTGGTPFYIREAKISINQGLRLAASDINSMRRDALDKLMAVRSQTNPHVPQEYNPWMPAKRNNTRPTLWARYNNVAQISSEEELDRVILPIEEIDLCTIERFGDKLIGELPAVAFPDDEPELEDKVAFLKETGLESLYANNIYGIELARNLGMKVHGGFGLNVVNTQALNVYRGLGLESMTASFELNMSKIKRLGADMPLGVVAYGYLPLMRFRCCPARTEKGCGNCTGMPELKDRMGIAFKILCHKRRFSTLLNSVPLNVLDKELSGIDYALLYFTIESAAQCTGAISDAKNMRKPDYPRTNGLYYRELI